MGHAKLLIAALLLFSCNGLQQNAGPESQAIADSALKVYEMPECFALKGRDTVMVNITYLADSVFGAMYLHYDGKDINDGSFSGIMKGDTLIADYHFMSEGRSSQRQIAFLRTTAGLIQGFAEIEEGGVGARFRDPRSVSFPDTMKVPKVDCR